MPRDFKMEDQGMMGIATAPDYPLVTDNITIVETKETKAQYARSTVEATLGSVFSGFGGLTGYEEITVDGHEAVRYSYDMNMAGIDMKQTQYVIFGKDFCDVVTFTSSSGSYDADFTKSAGSIVVD